MTIEKTIAYFPGWNWTYFLTHYMHPRFYDDQVYHDIFDDTSDLVHVQILLDHDEALIIKGISTNTELACCFCEESYYYLISHNEDSPFFQTLMNKEKMEELLQEYKPFVEK